MPKSLAASQKLMKNYLSELLTEEEVAPEKPNKPLVREKAPQEKKLEKLLEQVKEPEEQPIISRKAAQAPIIDKTVLPKPVETKKVVAPIKEQPLATKKSQGEIVVKKQKGYRKGSFQAMFFDVAGLIIAVPLIELGGIHNAEKTNSLMGKPDWFKGVMIQREEQINVVDTALWVMPEKCDQALKDALEYKYIIMLGSSQWGLLAENLIDTVTLEQEDVKWLDKANKRPWLAGLVKDRMCALLEVDAFIQLLNDGFNVNHK